MVVHVPVERIPLFGVEDGEHEKGDKKEARNEGRRGHTKHLQKPWEVGRQLCTVLINRRKEEGEKKQSYPRVLILFYLCPKFPCTSYLCLCGLLLSCSPPRAQQQGALHTGKKYSGFTLLTTCYAILAFFASLWDEGQEDGKGPSHFNWATGRTYF